MRYKALDNKIKCLTQQQTHTHPPKNNFHPRVINMTNISFSETEMAMLQKGPKYNLHNKTKKLDPKLSAGSRDSHFIPPPSERKVYRKMTAERINTLLVNNKSPPPPHTQHTL
jgi:hypothetical protein